ncbi:HotDog domain-containing protein [Protomyces lactucae-debilis]|uniref:HotDog domain-containing protein n=1 Tax=Protomyces lactucae-debilis TaxID=2754530 RepID=A0A1Y2F7J4_PROLT|nr:HotDog domain-containing protein [Protomyces lactucae-debilis]ORY79853.1 HotDog domain-containing protein [Protomyces lactucae-debilis]
MSRSKAAAFVDKVWSSFLQTSGMEPQMLKNMIIDSASPGLVKASLKIEKIHCNRLSILHGGTVACIVDTGGSLAVASRGLYATGVSTDMNIAYIKAGGQVGDTITATMICDSLGKTLAYTRVEFHNAQGVLFARGSHTKHVQKALKHADNIVHELRPETKSQVRQAWTVPT